MRIDCHGHFTTEPERFLEYRRALVASVTGDGPEPSPVEIGDDELFGIIESNQLRLQRERNTDLTLISPRASGMGHHVPGLATAVAWAQASNDLVARICRRFPERFAGVCQLPQTVEDPLDAAIEELERCVEAGFVGCNVNPDPSGGRWSAPPLIDPWWDPLWSAMTRLDVPAMIHVSGSTTSAMHTTGAWYLAADTAVFMQLLDGDLFERHPGLRLVIPHGGGAVPYHWGRYRGLAIALGWAPLTEHLLHNVFFDTCVYHQGGIDLLADVVPLQNLLFGSELLGAVKATDPDTGHAFDDTARYLEALDLDPADHEAVFSANARRVYPRLDALLTAQGR